MIFYVETINSLPDRLIGPIDPVTGWPKWYPDLTIDAPDMKSACKVAEKRFPGNVLAVIPD